MAFEEQREAQLGVLRAKRVGVLVTIKKDGRPQLSNVGYGFDEVAGLIRISVTDDRAKTRNLRRDPRASFYVSSDDMNTFLVAEGVAQLTPVAEDPHDATVDELVAHYRAVRGEHPDWAEFRAAMVADRRLLVRLPIDRMYGLSQ
ncbi:MAG: PPOX class F420-dependent oxidoreductase [Micromonosporaceae bacterium]